MEMIDRAITDTVLIIDDDKTTRDSLRMLLEFDGFAVQSCESGVCALELINKRCFEILLIDYRMPRMNGDEVTRLLRCLCPYSFIVGFSVEPKSSSFLHAGANAFIGKHELAQKIVPLLKNRHHAG